MLTRNWSDRDLFFIRRFLPTYITYLAPVLLCLYHDEGQPTLPVPVGRQGSSCEWLSAWWIISASLYGILRHTITHPRINGKLHKKPAHLHKQDLVGLLSMATGTGYLGRVSGRLEDEHRRLEFVVALIFFLAFYTVLFEQIKEYNVTLTSSGLRCRYTMCISLLMLATTGLLLRNQALACISQGDTFFRDYVSHCLLVIGAHLALIFGPGSGAVHIHHSWWAWVLSFSCIFDNRSSMVAQAMFLGVHIHGVAAFGVEPIFETPYDIKFHEAGQIHSPQKAVSPKQVRRRSPT